MTNQVPLIDRKLVQLAEELGYIDFRRAGTSHVWCLHSSGERALVARFPNKSASAWKNTVACLKRHARRAAGENGHSVDGDDAKSQGV